MDHGGQIWTPTNKHRTSFNAGTMKRRSSPRSNEGRRNAETQGTDTTDLSFEDFVPLHVFELQFLRLE